MTVLPNEILKSIIGFFGKIDLLSARLVDKTWQSYAETYLRDVYFSLKEDKDILDLIQIISWRDSKTTFPTPYVRFHINPELSNEILEKISITYGSKIQGLRFEKLKQGPTEYNMFELLTNTLNIEEIYYINGDTSQLFHDPGFLCLPKLRILEFQGMEFNFVKQLINIFPDTPRINPNCPTDESFEKVNNFLLSQAKYLKELEMDVSYRLEVDQLKFPLMKNLQKFELNMQGTWQVCLKLKQSKFPRLRYLVLDGILDSIDRSKEESMESVDTLILKWSTFWNFKTFCLKFPNLKKLCLVGNVHNNSGIFPFIFKNMSHVKELVLDSCGTWLELIGGYSKVLDFPVKECNIFNPNLGVMTALQSLTLVGCTKLYDLKAVPFLISCRKLSHLKYFEATVSYEDKELISPLIYILESNKTKVKINFQNQPK